MLIDDALCYTARHWSVLPVFEPVTRNGSLTCSCGAGPACPSPAKHPRLSWRDLTHPDAEQVAQWWSRWPRANIAITTGEASGLVVIDVDPRHGGVASLAELEDRHGPLPVTLTVASGGGGAHYYFATGASRLGNDAGRLLGPGLDVRAEGGIVIAPPSLHISGKRYRFSNDGPPAPLPSWIKERLAAREHSPAPQRREPAVIAGASSAYGAAALAGESASLERTAEGGRNHALNTAAFRLGQLVAAGQLHPVEVTDALVAAAMCAGLPEREARATAASGMAAGMAKPRAGTERHAKVADEVHAQRARSVALHPAGAEAMGLVR